MKKFLLPFLTALLVLCMLTGCTSGTPAGATPAATTPAAATSAASGAQTTTLTVGFDQNFPPYGYVDDKGEFAGFDIDLAKEAAKRMGYELVLQPIDWDAKDLELSSGAINCIWNGFTINGREDDYTWTDAYMDNSQVFVVRAGAGIVSFDDLAGKTVAVQTDSSAQTALAGDDYKTLVASFGSYITCADYNTAFMDLEAGAVDAIAMDIGVAKFQITGREDKFVILDKVITDEQYGVGFLLGNTELRDKVQKTLEEMAADGTFAKISEQWFGYDVCIIGK